MWEIIRANKRRSVMLMAGMAAALLVLGYLIGMFVGGPDAGWIGLIAATAVWFMLTIVSFASGDQVLLAASKAKPVTHDVHPQLFNIVDEMRIASGLPMPKIYIINDPAPNAFATGRKPETASIAVTAGLLNKLNRDELQGVVAHEMAHIMNRDILFITLAGVMLGSIVIISQIFLRGMFYSSLAGGGRRYSSGRGGKGQGGGQIILLAIAIIAAILAPIFATILYYSISRKREYLADASAVRLTRYPEGLASALEKIAGDQSPQLESANKATAPLYIANPLKPKNQRKLSDLTSTHPPISERVRILRNLSQGASLKDYSQAYSTTTKRSSVIPISAIQEEKTAIPVERKGRPEEKEKPNDPMHQLGDIMRKVNGFTFLTCTCGLKMKVPPTYKKGQVTCPRCKTNLSLKKA